MHHISYISALYQCKTFRLASIWLLVNNFLTRSLFKSRIRGACCCYFFWGICFKHYTILTSINRNLKESHTWIDGCFTSICHCCCSEVTWIITKETIILKSFRVISPYKIYVIISNSFNWKLNYSPKHYFFIESLYYYIQRITTILHLTRSSHN